MATQNPVEASHERQHELIERALHKIEGDVVWLKEYFTPDDDDTDRFSLVVSKARWTVSKARWTVSKRRLTGSWTGWSPSRTGFQ